MNEHQKNRCKLMLKNIEQDYGHMTDEEKNKAIADDINFVVQKALSIQELAKDNDINHDNISEIHAILHDAKPIFSDLYDKAKIN